MKYNELSEENKTELDAIIENTVSTKQKNIKIEGFGLCSTCNWFNLIKTEFKIIKAFCGGVKNNFNIDKKDPIKFCNLYQKRGEMSLYDMGQIALFIDINKTRKVGF